jgi:DDE superfamily endonuclease
VSGSGCRARRSGAGEDASASGDWAGLRISSARVARAVFPPREVAQVKAIACELPKTHGVPLSRFSRSELHRFIVEQAISEASASTIGRWLAEDAIKPWHQRSWIFPTDPDFLAKAGPVLDLYQRRFEGRLLEPGEYVICADAKPSVQARRRIHPSAPPAAGRGQRVEHEYQRIGAGTYLDAWDVHRGRVMGRTEPSGGIAAFDRLVRQVMTKEPYASAKRVFWIVDNGSDHRGQRSKDRLQRRWRNLVLVHTPVHASWLNQAEIYHSIIQRKLLDPNDFPDTAALARALNDFERHYNEIAKPFDWNFTRAKLTALMDRLDDQQRDPPLPLAARTRGYLRRAAVSGDSFRVPARRSPGLHARVGAAPPDRMAAAGILRGRLRRPHGGDSHQVPEPRAATRAIAAHADSVSARTAASRRSARPARSGGHARVLAGFARAAAGGRQPASGSLGCRPRRSWRAPRADLPA